MLTGKSILVTGGGSGIGRATAILAARAGACVTVTDLDLGQAGGVAEAIMGAGGIAQAVALDVTDEAATRAAVAAAVAAYGRLDGACNAAGLPYAGVKLHELPMESWDRVYDANLRGVFLSMKYQVTAMLESGGGSIVNISSTAGVTGIPNGSEYCASKGGVVGLTRGAAADYATLGIRVNVVLPGATRTPMLQKVLDMEAGLEQIVVANCPMRRLGTPEEIGFAVRWLLSDEASFVTGVAMPVDGGMTAM